MEQGASERGASGAAGAPHSEEVLGEVLVNGEVLRNGAAPEVGRGQLPPTA